VFSLHPYKNTVTVLLPGKMLESVLWGLEKFSMIIVVVAFIVFS
jgi:hypothetical protein